MIIIKSCFLWLRFIRKSKYALILLVILQDLISTVKRNTSQRQLMDRDDKHPDITRRRISFWLIFSLHQQ